MRENSLKMVASACGVLLRNGAVILPGAFSSKVLRDSVKTGWVDVSHEWDGEPIGIFDKVYMEKDTLIIEATFHSHEDAQKQRQIVSERLAAGKEVAVSIGYGVNYDRVRHFDNGKELWDWCAGEGYDMSRFDKAIKKETRWCWVIPEVTELNEVSICNIGMNPSAKVLEVNGEQGDDNDLGERVSLSDALTNALAAIERAKQVQEMRAKDGRTINPERVSQLSAIRDTAAELVSSIAATTSTDSGKEDEANKAQYLMLRARSIK